MWQGRTKWRFCRRLRRDAWGRGERGLYVRPLGHLAGELVVAEEKEMAGEGAIRVPPSRRRVRVPGWSARPWSAVPSAVPAVRAWGEDRGRSRGRGLPVQGRRIPGVIVFDCSALAGCLIKGWAWAGAAAAAPRLGTPLFASQSVRCRLA